jgi:type IV pilus secretin PilQ/predicted competence protein
MTNHNLFQKKALAMVLIAALLLPSTASAASAATPASFEGIEVSDDFVTIKLSTSVLYNSFLTQTPPRLVMELLDTRHDGATEFSKGQGRYLDAVRSSQFEKEPRFITRVVMDLKKMVGYKVGTAPEGLTVKLVGSVDGEAKSAAPAESKPVVAKRAARAPVAAAPVEAADAVVAEAPAPPVEPEPAAKPRIRVTTDAGQAMRRAGLDKTMTSELAATAQASDITKTKMKIVDDGNDAERSADRRTGSRIFRDIMARLPRDLVTLDFDNTDIRDVIHLLAAKAKINIVFGPDVAGSLTLHLSEVPFNEAFRTALSMMKLTTDQVGDNILRVMTPAELKKDRTNSTAITRFFQLNYAKAVEVKTTIDSVRAAEGRTGSSTADAKTNALIVTDTLEGLLAADNLIAQLDQRPRQVLIETKLVEVNANTGLNYGVQWDAFGLEAGKIGGKSGTSLFGSAAGISDDPYNRTLDQNTITTSLTGTGGAGAAGRGTGVSLAADRVFGALTLGRVTNNFILNATLTAAASEGKAKILSEPKIATLNNQAANINVTTQIPYVTSNVASTGVQTQTVSYVTTGIKLTVTPSINADGRITLQINPDVSQPSVSAAGSTATGAVAVDARTATTTVLVRDGETIVIGGLISDSLQDTISKIPLLGDIPILGWLFKKKSKTRVRSELLIFVTTRILPD